MNEPANNDLRLLFDAALTATIADATSEFNGLRATIKAQDATITRLQTDLHNAQSRIIDQASTIAKLAAGNHQPRDQEERT